MYSRRDAMKTAISVGGSVGMTGMTVGLAGCATTETHQANNDQFVRRDGQHLMLAGRPYRYVGTNMWYAAYAASPDASIGNAGRIEKELDRLSSIGINNIRLLGSGEVSPLKNSLRPAIQNEDWSLNEGLLQGLDKTLAEMGKRNMKAVLYLTNFWEWSGGMGTYVARLNGGQYIDMNDPAHPWPAFADFSSGFYDMAAAKEHYFQYVRTILTRVNTITGRAYKDDPTIQAWQLCNEPRPAGSVEMAARRWSNYVSWIRDAARLIKSIAPNHLVSIGHEGLKGAVENAAYVEEIHAIAEVDYVTCHIWPQNWSWTNNQDLAAGFGRVAQETEAYLQFHIDLSKKLNKPLIVEEFGYPRDNIGYDPATSTTRERDRFYGLILAHLRRETLENGPLVGINFWAWGGAGRALHDDHQMRQGETAYVGDPPHEPQGWYSVFDSDASTIGLLQETIAALR